MGAGFDRLAFYGSHVVLLKSRVAQKLANIAHFSITGTGSTDIYSFLL
jgi:hypothetical protein